MSVKLRLSRVGAKKNPFYRVVVTDSRSPRDGRFIEHVGVYDPNRDPVEIRFDMDRVKHLAVRRSADRLRPPSPSFSDHVEKAQSGAAKA